MTGDMAEFDYGVTRASDITIAALPLVIEPPSTVLIALETVDGTRSATLFTLVDYLET